MRIFIILLLLCNLGNAGINECFVNGRFDANIGHDTLDCGNVDVTSWAIGVVESVWQYDNERNDSAYVLCEAMDPEEETDIVLNACNVLSGEL